VYPHIGAKEGDGEYAERRLFCQVCVKYRRTPHEKKAHPPSHNGRRRLDGGLRWRICLLLSLLVLVSVYKMRRSFGGGVGRKVLVLLAPIQVGLVLPAFISSRLTPPVGYGRTDPILSLHIVQQEQKRSLSPPRLLCTVSKRADRGGGRRKKGKGISSFASCSQSSLDLWQKKVQLHLVKAFFRIRKRSLLLKSRKRESIIE
jgi:hypothetical protein